MFSITFIITIVPNRVPGPPPLGRVALLEEGLRALIVMGALLLSPAVPPVVPLVPVIPLVLLSLLLKLYTLVECTRYPHFIITELTQPNIL